MHLRPSCIQPTRCGVKVHLEVNDLWFKFFKKGRVTVFTKFDVFSWNLETMIFGKSHTCDLNRLGVKGYPGVNDLCSKFLKKGHCMHILWNIFMGLGYNDPWVVTHVTSTEVGQRSSWVHWPEFLKKIVTVSTYSDVLPWELDNDCKSMWSRKQARLMVREPPCSFTYSSLKIISFSFENMMIFNVKVPRVEKLSSKSIFYKRNARCIFSQKSY